MADLKINQLDPIIPVSTGTGATYSALSDADLFIVKMKVRGTAIGDEDRKLTWLELRNSLNLGQYMGTIGGNFTGDITLSNNKAVKGQQTGAGADIALLYVDTSNRVVVGNITNLTRVASSSIPQYVDGTGTYNFITSKNLPVPGDINAYTKAEVNAALDLKANLAGANFTDVISLPNNKAFNIADSNGTMRNAMLINSANNFWVGDKQTNLKFNSLVQPTVQVGSDTTNYAIYHAGNKPTAADLNLYTKAQVDAADNLKLDKAGGIMTGSVFFNNSQGIGSYNSSNVGVNLAAAVGDAALIGDTAISLDLQSSDNPTVKVGSNTYTLYHTGNKPTQAELGVDTALALKMDKAGGTFTGTVVVANNVHVKSVSGASAQNPGVSVDVFYAGTNSLAIGDVQQKTLLRGYGDLSYDNGTVNTVYHTGNKPTFTDVGAYSIAQSDAAFARKGVNADITALNALTGALKVGANATQPLEVTTLQQVQALTSGTAGAVVGVVGGFIGAVMWFNGPRASIPAGWVAADGTLLNRADYPDLWAAANSGALSSTTDANWLDATKDTSYTAGYAYANRGRYSTGNGSTTFRIPDLNGNQSGSLAHIYLSGLTPGSANPIGLIAPSAAPNITGGAAINLSGVANIGVQLDSGGAFADRSSVTNLLQTASGIQASGSGNTGFRLDASRSNAIYGRTSTEINPNTVYGVWIIRASNSFAAANTNFAVYNGADTLPASGTVTNGGLLQSIYNVNGVQDHSVNLQSQRAVGSLSSAVLTVNSQVQGSLAASTAQFLFSSSGDMTVPGSLNVNGIGINATKIELTAALPYIDFHYNNTTTDYTHRIVADSATNLTVSSTLSVNGDHRVLGALSVAGASSLNTVTANSVAATTVTATSGVQASGSRALGTQGTYLLWNESAGTGTGSIVVNPGSGVGGFNIRCVNSNNSAQTGQFTMLANGRVGSSAGYMSKAGLNGSLNSGNVFNIERGSDANNYLWIDTSAFLIPQSTSDLTYKKDVTDSQEGALDRVLASKTIEFNWKDDTRGTRRQRGFGAQTQQEIDEKHVVPSAGEGYPMSLDTTAMLADAYDAIKSLAEMVKELQSQVSELKAAKA